MRFRLVPRSNVACFTLALLAAAVLLALPSPAAATLQTCKVVVSYTNAAEPLSGSLQTNLRGTAAQGRWAALTASRTDCAARASFGRGNQQSYSRSETGVDVSISWNFLSFTSPTELFDCAFYTDDSLPVPVVDDFFLESSSPELGLEVTSIECADPVPVVKEGCRVRFTLDDTTGLDQVVLMIDYSDAPGEFTGDGFRFPDCTPNTRPDYSPENRTMTLVGARRTQPELSGPFGFNSCNFRSTPGSPLPERADFIIDVTATDDLGMDVIPPPGVLVDIAFCIPLFGGPTTTLPPSSTTTLPASAVCGDANSDAMVSATDAFAALQTAVGAAACALCRCDADGSEAITATDALRILTRAVGQLVPLLCEPCRGGPR